MPVWVHLPHLPLEFWREDILGKIASLLGKPIAIAHQSLDKKFISYARICIEINLNNPLPDSLEICLGASSSWVQQLDYESIPFRCRVCHEYGHLLRQCPRNLNSKGVDGSTASNVGGLADTTGKGQSQMANTTKRMTPQDTIGKGKAQMQDKDGFTPVRPRTKGCGQKRKEKVSDPGFNRFEVLDSMALEDGIPPPISSDPVFQNEGAVPNDACGDSQVVVYQNSEVLVAPVSEALVTPAVLEDNDVLLADMVKDVLASGKGKGSPLPLGLMPRPFKRVSFTPPLKSGRKTDHEKINLTGDLLIESGTVKPLGAYFPNSTQ